MEFHLSLRWEDAWICFEAALICFSSYRSSTDYLATKHPMDVSSLAGRVMSSLRLSTRIHPITEWPWLLPSSLPVPPTACLAVSLPNGRRHEVTTFRVSDNRYLRPTLSAGGNVARVGCSQIRPNHPHTFWFKPYSSFGLSIFTAVASVYLR